MNNKNFIAKEGRKPILIVLVITIVLNIIDLEFFATLGFLLIFTMLYVYRNTDRYIFENTANLLAPIDGKVIAVDKLDEETKIYIEVGILGDHMLRAPFHGQCKLEKKQNGLHLAPSSKKADMLNEQITCKFSSIEHEEKEIGLKLVSGPFNPKLDIELYEEYAQGSSIGIFVQGLLVVSCKDIDILVDIGEKIKSGQTIIGKF